MKVKKRILNSSEKEIIADFYKSHYYDVLTKAWENEKRNIEKQSLLSMSMEDVYNLKGQYYQITKFYNFVKKIYKEVEGGKKHAKGSRKKA